MTPAVANPGKEDNHRMPDPATDFTPGQTLSRQELHRLYGGRPHPRVSMSNRAPVVFLFIDPSVRENGWQNETYVYIGEGRNEDQRLTHGNAAILKAADDGRVLSVWLETNTSSDTVTYAGMFTLNDPPYLQVDLEDPSQDRLHRTVFAFQLLPQDHASASEVLIQNSALRPNVTAIRVTELDIEDREGTPQRVRNIDDYERTTETLVMDCARTLRRQKHDVIRHRIEIPGEAVPVYSTFLDRTTGTLYGCIPSVTRERVRETVGELLDVARFLLPKSMVMLCPSRPRNSLTDLLHNVRITPTWKENGTWWTLPEVTP